MQSSENNIEYAASIIKNGGLVAFPTETVYGLGANALNPIAVARIFEAKQRPSFDPLIVHITNMQQLNDIYASPINQLVYRLAEFFWPGPLTIVHRKNKNISGIVTADLDTVAVRMPSHPMAKALINLSECPIAAPSANKFGQLSPTQHKHVTKQNMNVDYILKEDNGILGIESTVVYVDQDNCTILRPGIITFEELKKIIPQIRFSGKAQNSNLPSPGLLKSHYSPKKPLNFLKNNEWIFPDKTGIILHSQKSIEVKAEKIIYTSITSNFVEVAANIFTALHQMEDDPEIEQIFIEKVAEEGLGIAIMDRLKKACFQYL